MYNYYEVFLTGWPTENSAARGDVGKTLAKGKSKTADSKFKIMFA